MDWQANRLGLISDGTRDRLADPPGGVSAELVAAPILELLDGSHQPDISLLDEVEHLESALRVSLRDGDNQAEVRLNELGPRRGGASDRSCDRDPRRSNATSLGDSEPILDRLPLDVAERANDPVHG